MELLHDPASGALGVGLSPQPSLIRIEALIDQVREAGLAVDLHLDGALEGLPAGVDLSAYRIVQEALTNTLKHAGASRVEVELRRTGDWLEVEVADDGRGSSLGEAAGHGLIGMRERASLHGAELEFGSGEAGGFVVRARFPLAEEQLV